MKNISGLTITEHQNSKRIVNIQINDEILDKLIFSFLINLILPLLSTNPLLGLLLQKV